jgi:hypothetical protein
LLVRTLGSPLILGPMSSEEWEEYLDHKFPAVLSLDLAGAANRSSLQKASGNGEDDADYGVVYYRPLAG